MYTSKLNVLNIIRLVTWGIPQSVGLLIKGFRAGSIPDLIAIN